MTDETTASGSDADARLAKSLLVLRVALGLFLLQWGIEKFVLVEGTTGIFEHFYKFVPPGGILPVLGALECALAIGLLIGAYRKYTYGAAFLLHGLVTIATWQQLIDPYGLIWGRVNHLFAAGVPVLAGFWLLYQMRDKDTYSYDATVAARKAAGV